MIIGYLSEDKVLYDKIKARFCDDIVIKNYNELCNILDLPIVGGKQKQKQIANLKRFVNFRREGHSYIITEIFDSPKEKIDKRTEGNRSLYVTFIESILLDYFIKKNLRTCNFTKKQLWIALGLVNDNYTHGYGDNNLIDYIRDRAEGMSVKSYHINKFYENTNKKLNDIINSAFKSLKNRKLIEYTDNEIIAVRKGHYFVISDDNQIEKILQIEKDTLNDLGCKSLQEVIFNKDKKTINMQRYYQIRNKKLFEYMNYDYIFYRYHIVCNRKYLKQGLSENAAELRKALNSKFRDAVNNQTVKDYKKNIDNYKGGKTTFLYSDDFVNIQRVLAEKLLNIDEEIFNEYRQNIEPIEEPPFKKIG